MATRLLNTCRMCQPPAAYRNAGFTGDRGVTTGRGPRPGPFHVESLVLREGLAGKLSSLVNIDINGIESVSRRPLVAFTDGAVLWVVATAAVRIGGNQQLE